MADMTTHKEALTLARQLLWRYRHETPIGNQPHMICQEVDEAFERIDEALAQSAVSETHKQEPVAHPFEDKAVISSLSWAAGLIEQAYRECGGHNGADSWLMNYADKQGERIRQADHREWEKVNGRWQVKATPPQRKPLTDELVLAGARALAKRHADSCGLDFDDVWKYYADEHKDDARAVIEAAHGIKGDA